MEELLSGQDTRQFEKPLGAYLLKAGAVTTNSLMMTRTAARH